MRRIGPAGWWFFVAFGIAVLGFTLSTTVGLLVLRRVNRQATAIVRDTVPATLRLTELRARVRLIDDWMRQYLEEPDEKVRRALMDDETALRAKWQAHRTLAGDPAERRLWADVERDIDALELAAGRIFAFASVGRMAEARVAMALEFEPVTQRLGALLERLIDLNVLAAQKLAREIERVRRRHVGAVLGLDGLAALATILAAVLAYRGIAAEKRLLERRADELDLFAARVSHDLLSPLAQATLILDVVSRAPLEPRLQQMALCGRDRLRRARELGDALLEFARAGGRPVAAASCEVAVAVACVVDEILPGAAERGVTVEQEVQERVRVACHPALVRLILENLARNAVQYMGDRPVKRVVLRVRPAGEMTRLEVEDTGPGLPPDLGERVWEPFVRGHAQRHATPGVGLGLATVKRVVDAHGGRVGVQTTLGRGSTFWVELPTHPTDVPA